MFASEVDDSLTWDFIPWLRAHTKLPIIVKVSDVLLSRLCAGLPSRRITLPEGLASGALPTRLAA